jgi:hypothetical protein
MAFYRNLCNANKPARQLVCISVTWISVTWIISAETHKLNNVLTVKSTRDIKDDLQSAEKWTEVVMGVQSPTFALIE